VSLCSQTVDIDNITSVRDETSCAVNSRSPNMVSKYSLSILSGELSLLDLDAIHVYQFAEWTDGIRALGKAGGAAMAHKESLEKIKVGDIVLSGVLTCDRFSRT
jgi:engulfment/cell motility protein 1